APAQNFRWIAKKAGSSIRPVMAGPPKEIADEQLTVLGLTAPRRRRLTIGASLPFRRICALIERPMIIAPRGRPASPDERPAEERHMGKLDGKIALITGGSSGIGLASARKFVDEGAYVFITGRREAELAAAVKQISRNVIGLKADASNSADL